MIADENLSYAEAPDINVSSASLYDVIMWLLKQSATPFISYIKSDNYSKKKLSEDDFSQIYIEQAQILIRKHDYPFNVNAQYRDITNLSKGFSDFYFYPNESGISTASIFSVESKRLPSPDRAREKEYVIGLKNNGGIERYKTEKHGKGLDRCGIIGFVEKETSKYWLTEINSWIENLSDITTDWKKTELLNELENTTAHSHLQSTANRKTDVIKLDHLWINIS